LQFEVLEARGRRGKEETPLSWGNCKIPKIFLELRVVDNNRGFRVTTGQLKGLVGEETKGVWK
jgi:hypothetical protein